MTAVDAMACEAATLFANEFCLGMAGEAYDQELGTASPQALIAQAVALIPDKDEQLVFTSAIS
jgi:hypothetical protein